MHFPITYLVIFLSFVKLLPVQGDDDHPAQWMSGKFGMGFRIMAGDYIERHQEEWGLDWNKLVDQFTSVGASHVIVNLSGEIDGTTWMSHHPVLYRLAHSETDTTCEPNEGSENGWDGTCQTAPSPSEKADDYFKAMTDAFHSANIKVIVYVASQGPAMFKSGSNGAYDIFRRSTPIRKNCVKSRENVGPKACFEKPDKCCSPMIGNWIKYVKNLNGGTIDYPKLHTAFADVVIGYYAEKYKNDIDGWWFDHAKENQNPACGDGSTCGHDFIDKAAVKKAILVHQPNVPITFNSCKDSRKSPLRICSLEYEDFTAGDPPSANLPFESNNYPMVTSIEETPDGFFYNKNTNWYALGHIYMPTGTAWEGVTIPNVWTNPYPYSTEYNELDFDWGNTVTNEGGWNKDAKDWFERTLEAGGSWTWQLPRQSDASGTYYLLHPNHLALVKSISSPPTTSQPSPYPSPFPTGRPSYFPTTTRPTSSALYCKDATSFFEWKNNNKRSCQFVKTRTKSMCGDGKIKLFCPESCSECPRYGCTDVDGPFFTHKTRTKQWTCTKLARHKLKEVKCQRKVFKTTCPMTCGQCV